MLGRPCLRNPMELEIERLSLERRSYELIRQCINEFLVQSVEDVDWSDIQDLGGAVHSQAFDMFYAP